MKKDERSKNAKDDNAFSLQGVTKSFYTARPKELRKVVINSRLRWDNKIIALDGISLSAKKGECIGVIGNNGSGKSTLLKVIAGIIQADSGRIDVSGIVNPIVSLGAGTYPELTGKDNILTYLTLLGVPKREIEKNYESILDFSGLGEFENLQLKHYSTGMAARLAFSCVIHIDADIYLFDETFSVGDKNFQKKCIDKIMQLRNARKTIIITSHSPGIIRELCSRTLLLHEGRQVMLAETEKAITFYENHY